MTASARDHLSEHVLIMAAAPPPHRQDCDNFTLPPHTVNPAQLRYRGWAVAKPLGQVKVLVTASTAHADCPYSQWWRQHLERWRTSRLPRVPGDRHDPGFTDFVLRTAGPLAHPLRKASDLKAVLSVGSQEAVRAVGADYSPTARQRMGRGNATGRGARSGLSGSGYPTRSGFGPRRFESCPLRNLWGLPCMSSWPDRSSSAQASTGWPDCPKAPSPLKEKSCTTLRTCCVRTPKPNNG